MSSDTLSHVLDAVRLRGAVFFSVEASAPWVAEAPPARVVGPHVMPGAEHVVEYHVVVRGSAWAGLVDGDAVALHAGDVIVFPQGDAHTVSSAPGLRADPQIEIYRRPHAAGAAQLPVAVRLGGGGPPDVHVVCGFLGCDARPFNPLLAALPRRLVVRGDAGRGANALEPFIRIAVAESTNRRIGSECVLARLSELLFVEVLRRYVESLPADQGGWLGGLRDPVVGRALGLIHGRPGSSWSLEDLARQVGTSRSSLAERFVQFVGQPPMQYLARWRMQLAAGHLARGTESVAEIASRVGYDSEAAFSRAFKKHAGAAPGAWRRAHGAAPREDPPSNRPAPPGRAAGT